MWYICSTGIAVSPILLYRMLRHGRYRQGWGQRFGRVDRKDPQKKCIWLHAVSVGEVNAAQTLLAEIEKQFPAYEIVISTTTDTGFARADKLFGQKWSVFYFPFDLSWVTRRAFDRLHPSLCLLMELEVWPNFVFTAATAARPRGRRQRPHQRQKLRPISQDQGHHAHVLRQARLSSWRRPRSTRSVFASWAARPSGCS